MRNRTIKKQFWLNETEEKLLKDKSKKAGLSEAEFIRSFINDYKLNEKPDENFYYVLKDLRGIATNVNQLARQANRYQYVDSNKFFAIADKISDFIIAIQETYLTPVRKD